MFLYPTKVRHIPMLLSKLWIKSKKIDSTMYTLLGAKPPDKSLIKKAMPIANIVNPVCGITYNDNAL